MSPSLLQEVKDANQKYLAGSPAYLSASGDPFVVIACTDSRLTGVIEPALGLPRHRAVVIRTAGNRVTEGDRDMLRSVAVAVFIKGAREIFVVGHTDCALSRFSASDVIESFRKAGVPRSAFGDDDLRTWFGAFSDARENVLRGVEFLRRSAVLPRGVKVHGAMLGTEKGELEVVWDGDAAPAEAAPPGAERKETHEAGASAAAAKVAAEGEAEARVPPVPPPLPAGAKGPVIIGSAEATSKRVVKQPDSLLDAARVLHDFITRERQNAQFEATVAQIRTLLKTERDPIRIVTALEGIAERYKAKYPELPGALQYLRMASQVKGSAGLSIRDVMKRMLE